MHVGIPHSSALSVPVVQSGYKIIAIHLGGYDVKRTIVITGASTGIGAATAVALAKDSFIFVHYNASREQAEGVLRQVQDAGGDGVLLQADVSTEDGCATLVNSIKAKTSHIDVLVNNAGGLLERRSISDGLSWDLMERIFTLNTFSTMLLTSELAPLLRSGKNPSITNVSSVAMRTGAPTATIYGACKGAIDSFTRGSAKELAPDIRVNAVAPGVIETPFHERYSSPAQIEAFREATPLKRNGQADHIAHTIKFLVENDFITGETIDVNGGIFMR